VHQLITEEAMNVAHEINPDAVGAGVGGYSEGSKCFPPTPTMTMNVMTFGIHATLSYLHR